MQGEQTPLTSPEFQEKQKLLRLSELSVWIDVYDDIFSDFDPRPYSDRALSDDFLNEIRKISRETRSGSVELNILIPQALRNNRLESIIRKRLHTYFEIGNRSVRQEMDQFKKNARLLVAFGVAALFGAAYISYLNFPSFWPHLVIVLMEPAGWFSVWNGSDQLMKSDKLFKPDRDFYRKLTSAEIKFLPY